MGDARDKISKIVADNLMNLKKEETVTGKTTVSKKKYTKATKEQVTALIELANALSLQEQAAGFLERQEKALAKARQLSDVAGLTDEERTRVDVLNQEKKIRTEAIAKEKALAKARRREDVEALRNAELTRLDVLKHEENLRKRKTVQLKGVHGAMARLLGMHNKLAKATLTSVRNQRNLGGALSKLRSRLLIVSFGVGLVQRSIQGLVSEYAKYQGAQARVNAALTSTGFASGQSVQGLSKLAAEIQKNTGVSDTFTLSSSALLTTFTAIGGETFPTAQKAIVDMTAAMNAGQVTQEGLKSSTIQVGKALNDPIKGLTSLSRVGVLFTAQQKKQIQTLVNSGKVTEAQAIILKELNKEFGNTASANSYEKSVRLLESTIGDLQKEIGLALMPSFESLISMFSDLAMWTMENKRVVFEYMVALGLAVGALQAYQKWLALSVLATKAGTTALVQLRIAMNALFTKTIIGMGLGILALMIQKIVEMSGAFEGLDKSVEDATNRFINFVNVQEAFGRRDLATEAIANIRKSLSGLGKDLIDADNEFSVLRKGKDKYIKQTYLLSNGTKIEAQGVQDLKDKILAHQKALGSTIPTFQVWIDQANKFIEIQGNLAPPSTSDQVKALTQKYKDQLVVLQANGSINKELIKTAQELKLDNNELIEALGDETHQYHELAKSIALVNEEKKRQMEMTQAIDAVQAMSTAFMQENINAQMDAVEEQRKKDIQAIKETSAYKRAQKRGDNKEMERLEKEASAKTLAERKKLFRMNQALAIASITFDYLQGIAKEFSGGLIKGIIASPFLLAKWAADVAIVGAQKPPTFAQGGDFTTTGPQMIMVGDNPGGRERVQVTPLSSPNIAGPQGGTSSITVNVSGNVMSQDYVEGELAEQIKEAIRRGNDFGIS